MGTWYSDGGWYGGYHYLFWIGGIEMLEENKSEQVESTEVLEEYERNYLPRAHLVGISTLLIAVLLCLLPPLYLSFVLGYFPGWDKVLAGFLMIASSSGAYWIVEPISYFPTLGVSGTYMSFLAGNIANQRLPAAAAAQNAIGAKPGTKKAEMAGVLGITSSIIVNIITLTIIVIAGVALMSVFPPAVQASFKYVLPGVFGAMFGQFAMTGWIYALFALPVGLLLSFLPIPAWLRIPITVFWSVFIGITYYERTKKST